MSELFVLILSHDYSLQSLTALLFYSVCSFQWSKSWTLKLCLRKKNNIVLVSRVVPYSPFYKYDPLLRTKKKVTISLLPLLRLKNLVFHLAPFQPCSSRPLFSKRPVHHILRFSAVLLPSMSNCAGMIFYQREQVQTADPQIPEFPSQFVRINTAKQENPQPNYATKNDRCNESIGMKLPKQWTSY